MLYYVIQKLLATDAHFAGAIDNLRARTLQGVSTFPASQVRASAMLLLPIVRQKW